MNRSRIGSALSQYNSISVTGGVEDATPHRLIQMLMEGALDKIATAKGHMLRRDLAEKGRHISWAISIISGLQNSLDMKAGGEISTNLNDLYDYMVRRLVQAGSSNDPTILDEVSALLLEVKSAWDVLPKQLASNSRQAAS